MKSINTEDRLLLQPVQPMMFLYYVVYFIPYISIPTELLTYYVCFPLFLTFNWYSYQPFYIFITGVEFVKQGDLSPLLSLITQQVTDDERDRRKLDKDDMADDSPAEDGMGKGVQVGGKKKDHSLF